MSSHQTLHDNVELYALHTLDATESAEFERHLAGCETCQEELAQAHAALAALVPDEAAPTEVWPRIEKGLDTEPVVVDFSPRRRLGVVLRTVTTIAAAGILVLAGVLIGSSIGDSEADRILAAAEEAAAQPGSDVAVFEVDGQPIAEVIIGPDGIGYVVPTEALEPLDTSRTYQLWVINPDGDAISAGVLGHDPTPSLFTWADEVSGFALTREVAGGVVTSAGDVVAAVTDI